MTWGVIWHDGKPIHYIIENERVKAYEVGSPIETRTPELLEAIRFDHAYQQAKKSPAGMNTAGQLGDTPIGGEPTGE